MATAFGGALFALLSGLEHWVPALGMLCTGTLGAMLCHVLERSRTLEHRMRRRTRLMLAARHDAERANQLKSEFLANMSHEIRTPMTAILGFAEILDEELEEDLRRDAVGTIRRNGEHLLGLINDILDISKIEARRMEVERVRCAPRELLEDVRSLLEARAHNKGLELEVACEEAVPAQIRSDPTRLRQILINLVGNAIKFTSEGGVRLHCSVERRGVRSPMLRFEVEDSGIGMAPAVRERLFEPFVQAEATTTRRYGGTGLGLAISRELARLLGGDLSCGSAEGHGSTFTLLIDPGSGCLDETFEGGTAPDGGEAEPRRRNSDLPGLDGLRILLAEDGIANQKLILRILQKAGATVEVVENGARALEALWTEDPEDRPFDLLLLDMQMPVMDGYTCARNLRARGEELPILALTANAMASDRQRCLDAGCDEYATKPIDRFDLLTKITTLCEDALATRPAGAPDARSR